MRPVNSIALLTGWFAARTVPTGMACCASAGAARPATTTAATMERRMFLPQFLPAAWAGNSVTDILMRAERRSRELQPCNIFVALILLLLVARPRPQLRSTHSDDMADSGIV